MRKSKLIALLRSQKGDPEVIFCDENCRQIGEVYLTVCPYVLDDGLYTSDNPEIEGFEGRKLEEPALRLDLDFPQEE